MRLYARLAVLLSLVSSSIAADSLSSYDTHPCSRECSVDSAPMLCEYEFLVETYASMTKACYMCPFVPSDCERPHCVLADGFARLLFAVNRQLPAPQIRVCEGDTIKVTVENHMNNGEATTIHWHGIHHMDKAYMDGVPMITQCPLLPLNKYQYSFEAYPYGTHYYHSHVGMQRGDGFAGALVIRPRHERHSALYQHDLPEHTITIQDWYKNIAGNKGVLHLHARDNNRPDTIIINGRAAELVSWPSWNSSTPQPDARIPYSTYNVTQGDSYRFRLISNAVMNCPIEVYIENHTMLAIASDGSDIEAIETDVLVLSGGERWDVVVNASQPVANYWMYFRGLTDCSQRKTQSLAVLHYDGVEDSQPETTSNKYDERPTNVRTLNPFNMGMVTPDPADNHLTLSKLRSLDEAPAWITQSPTTKAHIHLGLHRTNGPWNIEGLYDWKYALQAGVGGTYLAQINRVHGAFPKWPYLSQYKDIPADDFCDLGSPSINETYCSDHFCHCTHRLKVKQGEIVELIMSDRGKHWNISNHPMHIHGQYLHILAVGQHEELVISKEYVEDLDEAGNITRNYDTPILKDTVMMPVGGYVVTKFKADNPGPWLLHCHNELHVEQGMSMVIEVGDPDTWPQDPDPKYKCGAYIKNSNQLVSSGDNSAQTLTSSCYLLLLVIFSFFYCWIII